MVDCLDDKDSLTYNFLKEKEKLNEKRKQIAQDVINNINSKWIKPTTEKYFAAKIKNKFEENIELNKILKDNVTNCEVCAIGAIFVAALDRHDKLKFKQADLAYKGVKLNTLVSDDPDWMFKYLRRWFSKKQLRLMEYAFEGSLFDDWNYKPNELKATKAFYIKHRSAKSRAIAIMENVIANDGKFIPPES